jgi:hypothetical protein
MTLTQGATWGEFAAAEPDLAEHGAKLLGEGVAFIGTTAIDGSPRVAPFTPLICDDRLVALLGKQTVKYQCLLRDPRFSIHAVLGPSDEEFMILGQATASDDWATRIRAAIEARKINMTSKNDVAFEFRLHFAHWAIWHGLGTPNIHRESKSWRLAKPVLSAASAAVEGAAA